MPDSGSGYLVRQTPYHLSPKEWGMLRRWGNTPTPPAAVLKLLAKEERARLLLLIVRAIKQGWKVRKGDRKFIKRLTDHWPGMVLEPNPESDPEE